MTYTETLQAGKTSILVHVFPDFPYVILDYDAKASEAENAPHDFLESLIYPVIIDEAQYHCTLRRNRSVSEITKSINSAKIG